MNEKLLLQAVDLFDTLEKWETFCELADNKQLIEHILNTPPTKDEWEAFNELASCKNKLKYLGFKKMRDAILYDTRNLHNPNWTVKTGTEAWDINWELKVGEKCFVIHFWGDCLHFELYNLNQSKLLDIIKCEERFQKISQVFREYCTLNGFDNGVLPRENQKNIVYTFNNQPVLINNSNELSWYAHRFPMELKEQLMKKVSALQSPELVELYKELLERC